MGITVAQRGRATRWLQRIAALACAAAVIWLLSSYVVARRMTGRAQPRFEEPAPTVAWGKTQPISLTTADGQHIGAWFIDNRSDGPIVLLLHGNSGCRSIMRGQAERLNEAGYSSFLLSFRAHGDSTGELNDFGFGGRYDVVAAVDWLEKNHPGRPITVWGQSLGAAAACFAAKPLGERVRGYILECPYRDLRTAVWNRLNARLPPVFNFAAYAGLLTVSPLFIDDIDAIAPINAVSDIPSSVPVLVLAGSEDRHALPAEAQAIAERIAGHATLKIFPGAGHLGLDAQNQAAYRSTITNFLQTCVRR